METVIRIHSGTPEEMMQELYEQDVHVSATIGYGHNGPIVHSVTVWVDPIEQFTFHGPSSIEHGLQETLVRLCTKRPGLKVSWV